MERIEIVLPLPPKEMHPNARVHWKAKLRPKKKQREAAFWAGLAATNDRYPLLRYADVKSIWFLARRNDPDSLIAWLKATFDGLQQANVLATDAYLTHLPPEQFTGKAANGERKLVLTITERKSE